MNYANKHKGVFYELSLEKRMQYVETAICKDQKFRNAVKGMLIGQFTVAEYTFYIQNSSKLNKRMMNLVFFLTFAGAASSAKRLFSFAI